MVSGSSPAGASTRALPNTGLPWISIRDSRWRKRTWGWPWSASGDLERPRGHFKRALEIDPENAWACYYLGNALMRQGRPEEAVAAFEQSLKLKPNLAAAANDLANVLQQLRATR